MKQYIIRRLILSVFILFGVSILLYTLIRMMPGDYIKIITAGNPKITPEMIENLRRLYGLDKSIIQGYLDWLIKALQGDFGLSFVYGRPVATVIGETMWYSFALAFSAFIFQILIAVPLGVISATKQYSKTDYAISVFALVGISLPSFFFAAVLQKFLAIDLKLFPLSGMIGRDYDDLIPIMQFFDIAYHFVLPIIVFTVTGVGGLMRYTRTNMLEVLNADYIRTARAKGLSENKVIYKHAFRNTLIPIVTMIGGTIPTLFAGAIITESIFQIGGVGGTAYTALLQGDIPFIMGFNMFLAVLTLLGTLIADITYAVVDPRVRLS